MKKILVLLASFNGEKFIEEQIRSILNQQEVDISIFIFDDKSFDNTVSIVNKIDDTRISIFVNRINSGSPALNFINSIKNLDINFLSNFDYVSLSDQDDIWLSNKTIKAIKLLDNKNASFYASNLTIWNTKNNSRKLLKKDYVQVDYDFLFEGASAGCTYVISIGVIIDFINDIKNIDFSNWKYLSHDWLLYFYARINKKNVVIDSNSYINYRIHENNVHGTMNLFSLSAFFKKIKLFFSGWYIIQSTNYSNYMLKQDTIEKYIYSQYNKNWFNRIRILLIYREKLFRNKNKYYIFLLLNIFYFNKKSKHISVSI
jgi:rhamnosyltransferase